MFTFICDDGAKLVYDKKVLKNPNVLTLLKGTQIDLNEDSIKMPYSKHEIIHLQKLLDTKQLPLNECCYDLAVTFGRNNEYFKVFREIYENGVMTIDGVRLFIDFVDFNRRYLIYNAERAAQLREVYQKIVITVENRIGHKLVSNGNERSFASLTTSHVYGKDAKEHKDKVLRSFQNEVIKLLDQHYKDDSKKFLYY
jgi:hypothetical protein